MALHEVNLNRIRSLKCNMVGLPETMYFSCDSNKIVQKVWKYAHGFALHK